MRANRYRRQIVLFAAAIVVPAAVLVFLSFLLLNQQRELGVQRSADRHVKALAQVRRELSATLEAVKQREINRVGHKESEDLRSRGVVFSAALKGDGPVMPWDVARSVEESAFAARFEEARIHEHRTKDFSAALAAYKAAETSARQPSERAEAQLAHARMLRALHRTEQAVSAFQRLMEDGAKAVDQEGAGYRFYAAQQLAELKPGSAEVAAFLSREVNGAGWLSLPELYTIRQIPESSRAASTQRLEQRIADWEQAVELAKSAGRIQGQVEQGAAWVAYGKQPWLVTVTPGESPLLIAVSAAQVAPPGTAFVSDGTGDILGAEFPGGRVRLSNEAQEPLRSALFLGIWIAGLTLVLAVAGLGGFLLLRDVNRDVYLTDLRAQFVASVSHELKTPLTAIRMFAETMAMGRGRNEESQAEYLATIVGESERLTRLVDNVLDFSKIEQGKKIYRLRAVRLEDVAESAVRAMQFPLAQQGFRLQVTNEDVPELQVDPDAIQQAILNLLTNAMKYSGDSREIELRLSRRNGDAVIEVADRGLGLSEEERKHVFEKFYRAPSHAGLSMAGTGLGLTLVAHIADAHRGRVAVESEPGGGSTFSIMIPLEART